MTMSPINPVALPSEFSRIASGAGTTSGAARPTEGANPLGQGLAQGASDFRAALQTAETTALQAASSGADPHALVEALAQAELAMQTAVTVRNKVVEAYQELLRMPV
jgi:flagellar hook-basal body complex protein FliE